MKLCLLLLLLAGCTENDRARGWGGTAVYKLKPGEKLVNITWKEADLWFLTRPMREGEEPENYEFSESSRFGVYEGTVKVQEQPKK